MTTRCLPRAARLLSSCHRCRGSNTGAVHHTTSVGRPRGGAVGSGAGGQKGTVAALRAFGTHLGTGLTGRLTPILRPLPSSHACPTTTASTGERLSSNGQQGGHNCCCYHKLLGLHDLTPYGRVLRRALSDTAEYSNHAETYEKEQPAETTCLNQTYHTRWCNGLAADFAPLVPSLHHQLRFYQSILFETILQGTL